MQREPWWKYPKLVKVFCSSTRALSTPLWPTWTPAWQLQPGESLILGDSSHAIRTCHGQITLHLFVPKLVSCKGFSTLDFINMQNHQHYFNFISRWKSSECITAQSPDCIHSQITPNMNDCLRVMGLIKQLQCCSVIVFGCLELHVYNILIISFPMCTHLVKHVSETKQVHL